MSVGHWLAYTLTELDVIETVFAPLVVDRWEALAAPPPAPTPTISAALNGSRWSSGSPRGESRLRAAAARAALTLPAHEHNGFVWFPHKVREWRTGCPRDLHEAAALAGSGSGWLNASWYQPTTRPQRPAGGWQHATKAEREAAARWRVP